VKWDSKQKKQIWSYQGREDKKTDLRNLRGELYSAIMRRVRIQKKDRKEIMKVIQEALVKYQ
jgi:hypothetical protein